MFTDIITVELLREEQVTDKAVNDINSLLHKQRAGTEPVTKEHLLKCVGRMAIVVAWNDNERVIGLGVLTQSGGLNFRCAEIRHLIVSSGLDILSIGIRIVETLRETCPYPVAYIDGGAWVQDDEMKNIFIALGFREKPGSRFRYRIVEPTETELRKS